jgi:CNT family concentrative nucleoside transporter
MAAPASLVIAKIVYPETEESQTKGKVSVEIKSPYSNLIDAISHGASDGMKISINVIAMLIGFIALIALINAILSAIDPSLSLNRIFGWLFYPLAFVMGVPSADVSDIATMMGQKMTINEFVAYSNLTTYVAAKKQLMDVLSNNAHYSADITAICKHVLSTNSITLGRR